MFGTKKSAEKKPFGERMCEWMMAKMKDRCPCHEFMSKFTEEQEEDCGCREPMTDCCGPHTDPDEQAQQP